jgi:hypothetical protein
LTPSLRKGNDQLLDVQLLGSRPHILLQSCFRGSITLYGSKVLGVGKVALWPTGVCQNSKSVGMMIRVMQASGKREIEKLG